MVNDPLTQALVLLTGFIAELVDSAIGMAYGVISNTLLITLGSPPAVASAIIHISEVFTTLASGVSHVRLGNVDKKLFVDIVIVGSIAGVLGAYFITSFNNPLIIYLVSAYLTVIGIVILLRAFGINLFIKVNRHVLAAVGGFLDSMGGGGWGPIVTSTLIAGGGDPRKMIGTVNLAEFFITTIQALTFITLMGFVNTLYILLFIMGGVIAAPIGAYVCKALPTRKLMIAVGVLLITINVMRFA